MTLSATKLTPNLIVSSVERSLVFYTEILGFARGMVVGSDPADPATVPMESEGSDPKLVFASVTSGAVEIFLNDRSTVSRESPQFAGLAIGGGNTMFIEVDGVDALHDRLKPQVRVVMPIVTQWYGLREFAIADPDGYVITFAQRVTANG